MNLGPNIELVKEVQPPCSVREYKEEGGWTLTSCQQNGKMVHLDLPPLSIL